MERPTVSDLTGDHEIARAARRNWLTDTPIKVLPETVQELWDAVEIGDTTFTLLLLEQLQAFERFLWPGYGDDSSNQHVLLLALLVNVKRQEHLPTWALFAERPDDFSSLFGRITRLSIDRSLSLKVRTHLIAFLVSAFQSLDNGLVRKECAPLVSIGIWHHLHSEQAREKQLAKGGQLQKAWRAAGKKYTNADALAQARLRFERSWLYTLLLDFLDKLYEADVSMPNKLELRPFCARFLELLCDLQSQLPTRRYVNALLQDVNTLSAVRLSPMYQQNDDGDLLRDLYQLLRHYTYFPIEDHTGRQLSKQEHDAVHNAGIARLQNVALKSHPQKLNILVLANYGSLAKRDELQGHLQALDDSEILELCRQLGLRSEYPEKSLIVRGRAFLDEIICSAIEQKPFYAETIQNLPCLPTEQALYHSSMLQVEEHSSSLPLATPKLNLQYLTVGDFLWRSFILYRCEAFYEIKIHLEDTVKRLQPHRQGTHTRFEGFSRAAIPIGKPAIIDTALPRVGEQVPAEVKVEVILDVSHLQPGLRKEWESLRPDDVVFLLAVHPADTTAKLTNGHSRQATPAKNGLKTLRCAEVISVLDEDGKTLKRDRHTQDFADRHARPKQRRLLLRLDAVSYSADKSRADHGKGDVYDDINLIIRRQARENKFKSVLESLKQLTLSDVPIPSWLQEVFLGYGDPASATHKRLSNRLKSVDYRDTFLDWQHLIESLPGKTVEPDPNVNSSFAPPYVLESSGPSSAPALAPPKGKKRRHDQPDGPDLLPTAEALKVSTYKPLNNGPYPTDAPKLNSVRFTSSQIEAITSGTQPGLTVIVGPPGTGKTDVATQIISNIYHNFPQQRTLLIAHSNQALNQLFQKITALDIDERHLLRLGHGEEDLTTEASFSKTGRVESFLERGGYHLAEVNRLAGSIAAPGAHGNSCETAEYFDQVYIQPRWKRFWDRVACGGDIIANFPFHAYFSDAPQPLFMADSSLQDQSEVARGCELHIRKIFDELADIRPFELLRAQRDKANYLLVKEARVIAMTSTHAAMRRHEIASLGFKYDNVIMEEAAQVTEAESFIPFVLQDIKGAQSESLQRIVLVGDHLQNSPVIQSAALRSYANLEQSLFLRLMRLGVPHILLDAQGRSRPSLAALYRWRYHRLNNLPFTSTEPEFLQANAGFRYEYQFIDVADYKGKGEFEPSPHYWQNLGEAEYAVALFQYMRLLGYPAEKISILCAYAGQRALIKDVLMHRCKGNRLFGMPGWVGTVDKYQGEQNDYIILSMVRTKAIGYLRDIRRLTVALSRARLGLYVLGRREVFESSLELREAFALLFERENKLALVTGEMFPAAGRGVSDEAEATEMEGVEHIGQYVYEMAQAKAKAIRDGNGQLPPPAITNIGLGEEDAEEDMEDDVSGGGRRELLDTDNVDGVS